MRNVKDVFLMALLLMGGLFGGCAHSTTGEDLWFGQDKLYHFVASAAIGAGSTAVVKNNGMSESDASFVGVTVAVGVGAGKEIYDQEVKQTSWSWKDMAWNLIGGTVGSIAAMQW